MLDARSPETTGREVTCRPCANIHFCACCKVHRLNRPKQTIPFSSTVCSSTVKQNYSPNGPFNRSEYSKRATILH
ncbi:uncharacterized protein BDV14DRAFT_165888 [Aspergillus stella-maris]|uniref:uncharacterized protein n=1 Tax=Aspergillus stella-maris TaxID=1810926 RepID=UPI003CCCC9EB